MSIAVLERRAEETERLIARLRARVEENPESISARVSLASMERHLDDVRCQLRRETLARQKEGERGSGGCGNH